MRKNDVTIPLEIRMKQIGKGAQILYGELLARRNIDNEVYLTNYELSTLLDVSKRQIVNYLKQLQDAHFVKIIVPSVWKKRVIVLINL